MTRHAAGLGRLPADDAAAQEAHVHVRPAGRRERHPAARGIPQDRHHGVAVRLRQLPERAARRRRLLPGHAALAPPGGDGRHREDLGMGDPWRASAEGGLLGRARHRGDRPSRTGRRRQRGVRTGPRRGTGPDRRGARRRPAARGPDPAPVREAARLLLPAVPEVRAGSALPAVARGGLRRAAGLPALAELLAPQRPCGRHRALGRAARPGAGHGRCPRRRRPIRHVPHVRGSARAPRRPAGPRPRHQCQQPLDDRCRVRGAAPDQRRRGAGVDVVGLPERGAARRGHANGRGPPARPGRTRSGHPAVGRRSRPGGGPGDRAAGHRARSAGRRRAGPARRPDPGRGSRPACAAAPGGSSRDGPRRDPGARGRS